MAWVIFLLLWTAAMGICGLLADRLPDETMRRVNRRVWR